jgi:hypothetical protein
MVEDIPFIQSVLYKSPYSGCGHFSGWKEPPSAYPIKGPPSTKYGPFSSLKGNFCTDPTKSPIHGPQVLQRVHFRPSMPYPSAIVGAGTEGLQPMPPIVRGQPRKPAYNLRAISGPSSQGPLTYGIATGIVSSGGIDFVVGSSGNRHHNLGLS